ncbi:glycosyltransferase family 4 protein [Roseomonas sp. HJA6]|uniref:Glycosyltransferase family 4 protein n=1 Tax=Roseomonas alba TaxID=2846776 RepID=A0ABS7A687_9PROT|nr:glycosyltransferase family 4 protein [Neoroseomonas alba]MBW6397813.1 glycosyltransferase family 4 protein [Neoroseomonas alba]
MRLLLWYWGRRGAGGQLTQALAQALARREDVAVALSLSAQAELLEPIRALDLPVDAVPTYASAAGFAAGFLRVPGLAARLRRQALDFRADAVVSVMTHLWTPLIAPGLKRAGLRYVPMVHDAEPHPGDPGFLWEWRLTRELDAAESAIAFSDAVAAGIRRRRPHLVVHRLPLGALLSDAAPAVPRMAGQGVRFVNLGRLRAYKGLDLLRDAWALFQPRFPGARLLVAGEGDADALAPGLAQLPGVEVQARWLSETEIATFIRDADAVVLPYREASQSGVAPVAHGLGVPVVATPVGGLSEQVRDGVDGLLARAMTAEALAEAMATLCDPARRAVLAEGARETGRRLNDWDGMAARLVTMLAR